MLEHYQVGLDQVRLLNTVHDSIGYGVHESLIEWFPQAFKIIAERGIEEIQNKTFPIKMGVGQNWTEAELNAK